MSLLLTYRVISRTRKRPPPQDHHRALGVVLLQGPRGARFFKRYPCNLSKKMVASGQVNSTVFSRMVFGAFTAGAPPIKPSLSVRTLSSRLSSMKKKDLEKRKILLKKRIFFSIVLKSFFDQLLRAPLLPECSGCLRPFRE